MLYQADNATKAAEEKVVSIQAEFDAFKMMLLLCKRVLLNWKLEKRQKIQQQKRQHDFENWSNDQLKEYLASKNIGYKPSATKAELLKLIPKE